MRIQRLVEQIEARKQRTESATTSDASHRDETDTDERSPESLSPHAGCFFEDDREQRQAAWLDLVTAETQWRELLFQHDLPANVSPRQVVASIRRRIVCDDDAAWDRAAPDPQPQQLAADAAWLQQWRARAAEPLEHLGCALDQASPEEIVHRLSTHRARREQERNEAEQRATQQIQQVRRELSKQQREWKQLLKQRKLILRCAGVECLAELEQRAAEHTEWIEQKRHLELIRLRIREQLDDAPEPHQIEEWLDTYPAEEIQQRVQQSKRKLHELQTELQQTQQSLRETREQVRQSADPDSISDLPCQLKNQIAQREETKTALLAADLTRAILEIAQRADSARWAKYAFSRNPNSASGLAVPGIGIGLRSPIRHAVGLEGW